MKREDVLTWDEYFMGLAHLSAKRSKDPSTQVGAVIVSIVWSVSAITDFQTAAAMMSFRGIGKGISVTPNIPMSCMRS